MHRTRNSLGKNQGGHWTSLMAQIVKNILAMQDPGLIPRLERSPGDGERVTGRKARGLQKEEIAGKCRTFLSLLSSRRKHTSGIFFLLYTNLKGFS